MKLRVLAAGFAAVLAATAPLLLSAATFPEEHPFTQNAFAAAQKAGRPILVHVTAPWCTTCAAQKPIIDKLLADPRFKQLAAFNIDFDTQKTLLRELGVRMQSTLIVFKGATEKGRSSGDTDPAALAKLLDKAI